MSSAAAAGATPPALARRAGWRPWPNATATPLAKPQLAMAGAAGPPWLPVDDRLLRVRLQLSAQCNCGGSRPRPRANERAPTALPAEAPSLIKYQGPMPLARELLFCNDCQWHAPRARRTSHWHAYASGRPSPRALVRYSCQGQPYYRYTTIITGTGGG